jgi:hypothetical protein
MGLRLLPVLALLGCTSELGAAGKGRLRRRDQHERDSPDDDPDVRFGALDAKPLKQCSMQLDECRSFVRESLGGGGKVPVGGTRIAMPDTEFAALTRGATDAANDSAATVAAATTHLRADYEKNGQVTLRGVWPRTVTQLALEELEEVWEHYRLPATFSGTAFLRAEKDNPRIDGSS